MGKSRKNKVDFLMEKIGARIQVSFETNASNNFIRIKKRVGGSVLERIVHNLSGIRPGTISNFYKVLGVADGQDFMHCLYLGSKYAKDFDNSVTGYIIESSDKKGCPMKVTFYKLNKKV